MHRLTASQITLSGFASDFVAVTATSPLDVIRTAQQINLADAGTGTVLDAVRLTWNNNGIFGFWKGNMTRCLHHVPIIVFEFYFTGLFRKLLHLGAAGTAWGYFSRFLSGLWATTAAHAIAYPLEMVRLRLIQQRLNNVQYLGTLDALVKVPGREGLSILVRGILPALGCHAARYTAHSVFSFALTSLARHFAPNLQLGPITRLASALLAAAVTFPMDTILKRVQASGRDSLEPYMKPNPPATDFWTDLANAWRSEQRWELFRGFPVFAVRAATFAILSSTVISYSQKYWLWYNGYTMGPLDDAPREGVPQNLTPAQLRHYEWEQQRAPLYRYAAQLQLQQGSAQPAS